MNRPPLERFDAKWVPEPNTGCWLWLGAVSPTGYARLASKPGSAQAHRRSWEFHKGPVPAGLVLDHMCRVRSCVNPDHLRVVTPKVNSLENSNGVGAKNAAKTHCHRGHLFDTANTRLVRSRQYKNGGRSILRQCKACQLARREPQSGRETPHEGGRNG